MSKNSKKNVPVLRFPEFEGNWQTKTLEELADWSSGGTPSKDNPDYWGGDIPWISASSMYDDIFLDSEQKITKLGLENGSKLATKGSILILVRGMILYKRIPVGIAGRDLAFNQDIKCLKIRNKRELLFLFYWLKANENLIKSLVSGTNVGTGKLDTSQLKILVIFKPFIAEQEKIASFLGAVDTRLTQLRRKHELLQTYKRGVMQKLFSQQIRFKCDDGKPFPDWEETKIRDVFSKIRNGFVGIATPFYVEKGIPYLQGKNIKAGKINSRDLFFVSQEFHVEHINSTILEGDILLVQSGHVGECAVVTKEFDQSNCHAVIILRPLKLYNAEFVVNLFYSTHGQKKLYEITTGNTIKHILTSDLGEMYFDLPCLPEQEKIADFLTAINQKIEAVAKQIELTEQFKKGLLQKMFV